MEFSRWVPVDSRVSRRRARQVFVLFVVVPTLLGALHHLDHIVRGNHVGWPITENVNAFTYSLAIYPLIALSLFLTSLDRVGARYWAVFLAASAALLSFLHLSPWALEPPRDVIGPYANPLLGYLAFGVVLVLIGTVLLGAAYAGVLSRQDTDSRREH